MPEWPAGSAPFQWPVAPASTEVSGWPVTSASAPELGAWPAPTSLSGFTTSAAKDAKSSVITDAEPSPETAGPRGDGDDAHADAPAAAVAEVSGWPVAPASSHEWGAWPAPMNWNEFTTSVKDAKSPALADAASSLVTVAP